MVLWQSDLQVSWRAQWLSLSLHGAVILLLLLAPWPVDYTLVWIALLTLVVLESVRSQRRIRRREGAIALLSARRVRWRKQEWQLSRRPFMLRHTILLTLKNPQGQREWLWLMHDSMDDVEWRQLRQLLLVNDEH